AEYEQNVEQPMRALVLAVAAECRARGLPLHAKEKNPVMRVYRDIRFSKDKTPFKTHVAAELRRSFSNSSCMVYIHISPAESFVAAGIWQPDRPLLQAWREAIAKDPASFEKMHKELARGGLEVGKGHSLSSMPRGFQNYADTSFSEWLKLTSFIVHRKLQPSDCTTPDLANTIVVFALAAKPMLEFGWRVEQTVKPQQDRTQTAGW
ncbi:MAG: DUF2461 domain-containing protein, partial [Acidobacteriaceae bacterium]|nr:DUF2461 domain-containing protein [Acidobacteriaceae bacterium]